MTYTSNAHPRILGALLAATVLPFTPALAQDATTAPPPVVATVPQPTPVTPQPVQAAPVEPAPVVATPQPEVAAPVVETPDPAPVAVAPRRVTNTRTVATRTVRQAAPVAAAPSRPVQTVAPPVTPPVAEVVPPPAPVAAPEVTTPVVAESVLRSDTTVKTSAVANWVWIALGVGALALIAGIALLFRRRNRIEYRAYQPELETVPVERSFTPAPEPVATREQDRPWIGLALLPVSASESGDTIRYELHVDNAGDVAAHDVCVTSFLLNGNSSVAEAGMIENVDTRSIDVGVGDQVPITSSVSVPEGVSPKILAEARYPLPGGGEGHIAARFSLNAHADGRVEAELDDVLERV